MLMWLLAWLLTRRLLTRWLLTCLAAAVALQVSEEIRKGNIVGWDDHLARLEAQPQWQKDLQELMGARKVPQRKWVEGWRVLGIVHG